MKTMKLIPRTFYQRDTVLVARELLGKILVRVLSDGTVLAGIIVETEAYVCDDEACHAFRGETAANRALFGPVGHAYIYFIYGMYYCCNIVARKPAVKAGGILIRALEPVEGIAAMQKFRHAKQLRQLTNGPGKLAQALHINKHLYGVDVTKKGELFVIEGRKIPKNELVESERIGISCAQEKLWRFYIKGNSFVSKA